MRLLWLVLPDGAIPLLVAGTALLLIVGVISLRAATSIVAGICAYLVLSPLIANFIGMLPWWISLLLFFLFVASVLRATSDLLLGDRASGHMVGILAADVARGIFRLVFFPFRLLARLAGL